VALRYTRHDDVHLAPAFDMVTTAAYADYAKSPPAIAFMGKKAWHPSKSLQTFITATFGVPPRQQADMVEQIDAVMAEVGPQVRMAMVEHPGFADIGKRMLLAWQEGLEGLRDRRIYALGGMAWGEAYDGLSNSTPVKAERQIIGRPDLVEKH